MSETDLVLIVTHTNPTLKDIGLIKLNSPEPTISAKLMNLLTLTWEVRSKPRTVLEDILVICHNFYALLI